MLPDSFHHIHRQRGNLCNRGWMVISSIRLFLIVIDVERIVSLKNRPMEQTNQGVLILRTVSAWSQLSLVATV